MKELERAAYYDSTLLHPLAALAIVLLGLLIMVLPRRSAILPFLFLVTFIPSSQRIAIATLDFSLLRILVICGLLRIFARGEHRDTRWGKIDKFVLGWAIAQALAFVALRHNAGAVIQICGKMLEHLGMYFCVRWKDITQKQVCLLYSRLFKAICFTNNRL